MKFLAQNWWYILLIGAFVYMMSKGGGCCGGGGQSNRARGNGGCDHEGHNGGNAQHGSGQMNSQVEMARDPVCGMYVNPETAIRQSVNGKTYYFCSEKCRNSFVGEDQGC